MKFFIGSDIHGDINAAQQMIQAFKRSHADYLICLGDLLNHGPRNPIPEHYAPLEVAALLNTLSERLIVIRGNCDSEVDQALCHFPMLTDYQMIPRPTHRLFCTHGHIYSAESLPSFLGAGDVFISGHTHIPVAECAANGIFRLNPGSVAIPRNDWPASYGLVDDQQIQVLSLADANILIECSLGHLQ
ncbi:phosphodiesterase [Celerinatantimonas sp. YJH-8]|uniref:phosphodiesterase n=1 Tax=Celerinatantimonas sp. YJH-8 TaxID=3228714 RepID=UPI0038C90E19